VIKLHFVLYYARVDIYIAHVVHDYGDPSTLSVVQYMIENGGFASPEKAR
jgi:hypothetical protein